MGKVIDLYKSDEIKEEQEHKQDLIHEEAWFMLAEAYNCKNRLAAELGIRDAVDLHDSYDTTEREKYIFKTFQRAVCNFINDNKNYKQGIRKKPVWN